MRQQVRRAILLAVGGFALSAGGFSVRGRMESAAAAPPPAARLSPMIDVAEHQPPSQLMSTRMGSAPPVSPSDDAATPIATSAAILEVNRVTGHLRLYVLGLHGPNELVLEAWPTAEERFDPEPIAPAAEVMPPDALAPRARSSRLAF